MTEACPTCKKGYSKYGTSFCSNAFHCCRDCVWEEGMVVFKCDHHFMETLRINLIPGTNLFQWKDGCYGFFDETECPQSRNHYYKKEYAEEEFNKYCLWLSGVVYHADHGRGTVDDGPEHCDCICRGTNHQSDCAKEGCGFCNAAEKPSVSS